jgi:hypothetical protein
MILLQNHLIYEIARKTLLNGEQEELPFLPI